MFQFAPLALPILYIQMGVTDDQVCWVAPFGYLRIDAISSSPKRFAGLRALRRLCVPRYPPRALGRLTISTHMMMILTCFAFTRFLTHQISPTNHSQVTHYIDDYAVFKVLAGLLSSS